ncbi:MAG: portal protein, partial [Nitrosomonadaceae bacterium]
MLTATDIRKLHDKAFERGQTTRERAADDLLFYWITQWDDTNLGGSTLQFRGQFDMLRKAGRQIITDIKANPTQVDFEPVDDTDPNGAEIIDGMYRSDMRNNTAIEAIETATTETVVCGTGAWELQTEYKTKRAGDDKQVIKRQPLNEANNTVFWDPNAKLQDKSDANYVSILVPYSADGYRDLVKELTGDDIEVSDIPASFAYPEQSYVFPWLDDGDTYYIARFYHRKKIK